MLKLVKQKGVYSYGYINSFNRFFDDKLSDRREFYSSIRGVFISEKDYLHAVNVWNKFEMKTMVDYHDLYKRADVFEKLIGVWLEYH